MTDIEHCECFACHGTGKFEPCADEDRPALNCAECEGKGWLEHVPADRLRGAVEALRAIVTETHAQNSIEGRADDAARIRKIAVEALARLGGSRP